MKAFPTEHPIAGMMDTKSDGMDLRDYLAAKAMNITYTFWMQDYYKLGFDVGEDESDRTFSMSLIAETAYEMADAMLKARNEEL